MERILRRTEPAPTPTLPAHEPAPGPPRRRCRDLLVPAVAVLVVLGLAGCRPDQPSPSQWHEKAGQALEDVASELATAELAVRGQLDDKMLGRSAVVLLVDAEESAGSGVEDFTALQPPPDLAQSHAEVSDALEHAAGLITRARTARVGQQVAEQRDLVRRLAEERAALAALERRVG